jgi:hypothetical protein
MFRLFKYSEENPPTLTLPLSFDPEALDGEGGGEGREGVILFGCGYAALCSLCPLWQKIFSPLLPVCR